MANLVDKRAELAVLAALVVRPSTFGDISSLVSPQSFGVRAHSLLASAIWKLRREDVDIDVVTLSSELERAGSLKLVAPLLATVIDESVTPTPVKHARRVAEVAAARRMVEVITDVLDHLTAAEERPLEWLDDVTRKVIAASDVRRDSELEHVAKFVEPHIREIEGRASGTKRGIPTGLEKLDAMTGGLHPGEFVVIAARPSAGKSALAMQIATHVARDKSTPVAFFSGEMKTISVMDRLVAEVGSVALHRVRDGRLTEDEMRATLAAYARLQKSGVWISDRRGWRVNEIVSQVRAWKRIQEPDARAVVIVDYLQIVRPSSRHSSREQEVAEISRTFQALAGEESVALVVLAQLVREAEKRGADQPPQLSDLRESGAIEQDADAVYFVHRPDRIDPAVEAGATVLAIAKQRQGECGTIPLWFEGKYQRFVHRDRDYRVDRSRSLPVTKPGDTRK